MHTCEESWWDGSGKAVHTGLKDMTGKFNVVDDMRNSRGCSKGPVYVTVIFGGAVNDIVWPGCWVVEVPKVQKQREKAIILRDRNGIVG